MNGYTDYLGNDINCGDTIAYPTCSGSSSADMNLAVIDEILPITPDDKADPKNRRGWIAGDHGSERMIPGKWVKRPDLQNGYGDFLRDDSKAYQLRVRKLRDPGSGMFNRDRDRAIRLKNVDRVIVVSSICDPQRAGIDV